MTDNSLEVIEGLKFGACDTPRGSQYYFRNILTSHQQICLKKLKVDTIREDEKYLKQHGEVRAFVALITRYVLSKKPRENILHCIGNYFARPREDIEEDVRVYLLDHEEQPSETYSDTMKDVELSVGEESEYDYDEMVKEYYKTIKQDEDECQYLEEKEIISEPEQTAIADSETFIRDMIVNKVFSMPSSSSVHSVDKTAGSSDEEIENMMLI